MMMIMMLLLLMMMMMFDVTVLDLDLKFIDEFNLEPVPMFVETCFPDPPVFFPLVCSECSRAPP